MRYLYMMILCSSIAVAEGLQGYIGIVGGYFKDKDNFSDHSNNHTIYSLDSKPKDFSRYLALPSMNLNYSGFYLKTEFQDNPGAKLGFYFAKGSSIYALSNGFGIEQTIGENFKYRIQQTKDKMYVNPYVLNTNRSEKKATINNAEIEVENILELISLEYEYIGIDMEDEVNDDAKQSGDVHDLSAMAYVIPFSDNIFGGIGIVGGIGNYDGDSNDYTKLGYQYRMMMELGKHQIQLKLSSAKYDFDTVNSYFGKIRDEKEKSYMLMYMKEDFLGSSDRFLNLILIKQNLESNIDFFDKEQNGVIINVGWKF